MPTVAATSLLLLTTGEQLALLRRRKGLSQEEVATAAGVHRTTLCRYETGTWKLPDRRIPEIVAAIEQLAGR